jgi:hypothetical protein
MAVCAICKQVCREIKLTTSSAIQRFISTHYPEMSYEYGVICNACYQHGRSAEKKICTLCRVERHISLRSAAKCIEIMHNRGHKQYVWTPGDIICTNCYGRRRAQFCIMCRGRMMNNMSPLIWIDYMPPDYVYELGDNMCPGCFDLANSNNKRKGDDDDESHKRINNSQDGDNINNANDTDPHKNTVDDQSHKNTVDD